MLKGRHYMSHTYHEVNPIKKFNLKKWRYYSLDWSWIPWVCYFDCIVTIPLWNQDYKWLSRLNIFYSRGGQSTASGPHVTLQRFSAVPVPNFGSITWLFMTNLCKKKIISNCFCLTSYLGLNFTHLSMFVDGLKTTKNNFKFFF